jgi:hypothetical protein
MSDIISLVLAVYLFFFYPYPHLSPSIPLPTCLHSSSSLPPSIPLPSLQTSPLPYSPSTSLPPSIPLHPSTHQHWLRCASVGTEKRPKLDHLCQAILPSIFTGVHRPSFAQHKGTMKMFNIFLLLLSCSCYIMLESSIIPMVCHGQALSVSPLSPFFTWQPSCYLFPPVWRWAEASEAVSHTKVVGNLYRQVLNSIPNLTISRKVLTLRRLFFNCNDSRKRGLRKKCSKKGKCYPKIF